MIRHFIKIAFRIFYKRRLYAFISLSGLAMAFSVSYLILIYASNERSVNREFINFNILYRVVSHDKVMDTWNALMSRDMQDYLQTSVRGLAGSTRLHRMKSQIIRDESSFPVKIIFVDPDFFRMFTNNNGINKGLSFKDPYDVIVSRDISEKYLQKATVGNEFTIKLFDQDVNVKISSVFPGFNDNSTIQADIICSMDLFLKYVKDNPLLSWHPFYTTFIMLDRNIQAEDIKPMLDEIDRKNYDGIKTTEFSLQSFNDFYLGSSNMGSHYFPAGDKKMISWLGTIAVLLLIISTVNYCILATANALSREKEYGIRKSFGSGKSMIMIQAISESMFITLLALPLALILTEILLPFANNFWGKVYVFNIFRDWTIILAFIGLNLLTGILSGIYLSFYISRMNPVLIIYPGARKSRHPGIEKYLLGGQVFIFIILVAFSILVLKQLRFFLHKDMGYDVKNMLVIEMEKKRIDFKNISDETQKYKIEAFKSEIRKYPEIINVSYFNQVPPYMDNSGLSIQQMINESGQSFDLLTLEGDQDMLETLGCSIIEGRKPREGAEHEAMLNETAVNFLSLEKPVGAKFGGYGFEIVGVVRDFNVQSFRMNLNPLLIGLSASENYFYFSLVIRYLPGEALKALDRSKKLISKIFYDYNSNYDFQEDRIMRLYEKEKKIEAMISSATFLILIVSVMGMFALSLYETERRLKEIGIRKINGAGVMDILTLLSKDFIQYVIIAFLLGGPIAFYFMVRWLEGFKYKTTISWWIFALTGASAILITLFTISYQMIRTARRNPVEILRYE